MGWYPLAFRGVVTEIQIGFQKLSKHTIFILNFIEAIIDRNILNPALLVGHLLFDK